MPVVSSRRDLGMLGGDRLDHRQRGIGLADARRMEPGEEAGWARRARQAVALGPPAGSSLPRRVRQARISGANGAASCVSAR